MCDVYVCITVDNTRDIIILLLLTVVDLKLKIKKINYYPTDELKYNNTLNNIILNVYTAMVMCIAISA